MKKGMSIIEATIAAVMLSLTVASIFPIVGWLITKSKAKQFDAQASAVLTAGVEVAYNVFLSDWDGYSVGTYHPAVFVPSGEWTLESGEDVVDARFTRKIRLNEVCRRNDTGVRVEVCGAGSSVDQNSKLITTTVFWKEKGQDREVEAKLMLTKL